MTKYVQHKSGVGEKWEVIAEHDNDAAYRVRGKRLDIHPTLEHYLPKSEYLEVPAPERWEDVTDRCGQIVEGDNRCCILYEQTEVMGKYDVATIRKGYRLVRASCGAFNVEKQVKP